MGHIINPTPTSQGDVHAIGVDAKTGRMQGVADRRRDGWAAGY